MKYPYRYEIIQTLSEFCNRSFVDEFAQSKGIFITKAVKEDLADHLSRFFFEHNDIELIRGAAFKENVTKTLAGFTVKSDDFEYNLLGALEDLRGAIDLEKEMKVGAILTYKDSDSKEYYKGSIDYVERKPGRIEFLQEEHRQFEYTIKPLGASSYEVLVECQKSNDARVFEDLIKKETGKNVELETLDVDLLSAKNTIQFFDKLALEGMPNEWRFIEVKKLIFRKGKSEADESEADESALSGITQAILDGNNLRENSFVKQSEDSGYRFTAMTYEYENKQHPFVIQVRTEFKSRPKVFEVSITNYTTREGLEEKVSKSDLDSKVEIELKTYIWKKAKRIYKSLAVAL